MSFVAGEEDVQGQKTQGFEIRYRKANGKEQKLSMVPTICVQKGRSGLATRYVVEPADYEASAALTGLFDRLVERFVR